MNMRTVLIDGKEVKVSKVKSIKPIGEHHVYDLEVAGVHNYFANGVNVHNCEYHKLLDHYVEKYDDENIYKFKDTFVQYRHRSLFCHPSGPSKRTMRGATRFFTCIDEIGWFDNSEIGSSKERASASEVYIALDRSLKTVRTKSTHLLEAGYNNIPNAYALNISSPSSHTDKIMTLVRTHEGSPEVFTVHLPTWEFNPMYKKSDFAKEYRDNPVTAERDFGANPPLNESPFLSSLEQVLRACNDKANRVSYKYSKTRSTIDDKIYRSAKITNLNIPISAPAGLMAIDAGFSNNSLAIVIGHRDDKTGRSVIDTMVEVAPKKGQDVINYNKVFKDLVVPLIQKLNVQYMMADRWQSIKLLQDIEAECGIQTEIYSLKYDDLHYFRDHLLADEDDLLLEFPAPEMDDEDIINIDIDQYPHVFIYKPVSHFIFQCLTVVDTGKGVDKGPGLTDDLFRATVLCMTRLLDDEFVREVLIGKKRTRNPSMGFVASVSGGGGAPVQNSRIGVVMSSSGGSGSAGGSMGGGGAYVGRR